MNEEMIKQIKEDFDAVITYSQDIPNPKTDKLFELWKNNKYWYYKVFGNKLIYEWPAKITFHLDSATKHQKITDFANQVSGKWGNDLLAQFITEQEDGFFNNITVEDFRQHAGWQTVFTLLSQSFPCAAVLSDRLHQGD